MYYKPIKILGAIILIVSVSAFGYVKVSRYFDIDSCLDKGGRWNYEKQVCETVEVDKNKEVYYRDHVSELLCKPLDLVDKTFDTVVNEIFESEEVKWPCKVVKHPNGSNTYFESSWSDTTHIWRITTSSKNIDLKTPYVIGDSIAKVIRDGFIFTFNEGDGERAFYFMDKRITDTRMKHMAFTVEEKYSDAFYNQVEQTKGGYLEPNKYLNPVATIQTITINSACK